MMKCLSLCLLAGSLTAAAAQTPPSTEMAGFHLKNRSAFTSAETTRPPFWPIGWTKQAGAAAPASSAAPTDFKFDPEQYSVTSILLGRPSLAVINGRSYGEGEYLRAPRTKSAPASTAKILVQRIADGNVVLVAGNQAFAIPLRRQQLSERKTDDELPPLNDR